MATQMSSPPKAAREKRAPIVVDPVHLVSWGGGLMPPVSSLEPRIREKALYSFYLPKLAEDGHSDEVLERCIARAHGQHVTVGRSASGGSQPARRLRSASVGSLPRVPPAASHSCTWMQHSHSLTHGRSELNDINDSRSIRSSRSAGTLRSHAASTDRFGHLRDGSGVGYLAGPERQWGPLARMLQKRSSV
ncbi:metap1 [Symbiodinium pilosum]|uniref:Metap1 protein n=1 Tax=Symbiodinium pilosum TaxID=2952 RepID=A0A812VVB0_SYMPI|nr:metap1 [Symbiodinium pilosum]